MPHPRFQLAPLSLAATLALSSGGFMAPPARAQAPAAAAAIPISLPAQPLGNALNELARQARLQLMVHPDLVAGRQAPAVSGALTARQALDRLLAGSGLAADIQGAEVIVRRMAAPAAPGAALAEVTVTAQAERTAISEGSGSYAASAVTLGKMQQSLREIPQSVSVMTRRQIDDQQLTTLGDALAYMPGVSVARSDEDSANTRGYKAEVQLSGVARASGSPDDFGVNDLETFDRVEVLRGPAGLLTGQGAPGGAVNYERKRPRQDFAMAASASAGSWSTYRNTLDVSSPLNAEGTLRGRFVTALQDGDSFRRSVSDKRRVLYGILEYDLTPQTTLGLSALDEKRDYVETRMGLPTYTDGRLPGRSAFVGSDQPSSAGQREYKFDLTHRFANEWTAKVTGYRIEQYGDNHFGFMNGQIDRATGLADMGIRHTRIEQGHEGLDANLSGPFEWLGRKHSALLGYQWLAHTYNIQTGNSGVLRNVDVLNQHVFAPAPLSSGISYSRAKQPNFYGVLRFKLRDDLTAIAGGTLTDYRYQNLESGAWLTDESKTDNQFTPYGGLVWDLDPGTTLYASYAEIFQSQYGRDLRNNPLPPRTGEQYEIGIKQGLLGDRLNLALALFRLQDTHRAIVDTDNAGCGSGVCYKAAGTIESKGLDAEISGSPLPGWNLSAGYTYNDVRYKKGDNLGQRFQPAFIARHLFKLWSHYDLGQGLAGVALPGWSVGLGVRAQSNTYQSGLLRQGSFAIYSATVGYRVNRHLRASLSVDNLFDKTYLSNMGTARLQNYYGEPRKLTLSLRTEF